MADLSVPEEAAASRHGLDIVLAGLSGLVAGLGHVPFALWVATLAGLLVAFLLVARADTWRRAFWIGWAFGAGYFALSLHWIVEPFLVDVARHGWMAPFAVVLLAGGLALFWGAAAALARGLARGPFALALAWSGAMALAEYARGHVLTGFPWALPAYAWTETPALKLFAEIGPYGVTLLTLALSALIGVALIRQSWVSTLPPALLALGFAGLLVAPTVAPTARQGAPVLVRLVQPDAPQRDKWDPEKVNAFFHRQLEYSAAAPRPALIVWPETAVPWDLAEHALAREMVAEAADGVTLAVGFPRWDGRRVFNSLGVMDATGEIMQLYDKHHLVPFGEYVPFGDLAAKLGITGFATRDGQGFSAGGGPKLLDFGRAGRALPLICYEAIFPQDVAAAPERPDFLLQVTNDAWFGNFAGPQQHFAQARVRAVEQGLPLVRVANTGISGVVDALGRVTRVIPLNSAGYADVALPPPAPPTLYGRTGDGPAVLLALFLIGLGSVLRLRKTD